ncbi:MAG: IclR family transcriptional regulator [Deferrisomatales bacterium]|nr:IclR family transcriptional regulator [Deferrisomatales bacterium]
MGRRKKSSYIIQSVTNAFDLLEEYRGEETELGVTELSKRLGLHKNNVFRLLATLESRGYMEQNKVTGNYRLGLRVLELGQVFIKHMGLVKMARPILEEISEKCNETAYLGVIRDDRVVYVDVVEATRPVRVVSRVGVGLPVYCSGVGKAQIAFESVDEVDRVLAETPLKRYTEHTLKDRDALMTQLEQVRMQGYALDDEEFDEGIRCVGVPVRDYTRRVIAGISVSGPAYRFTDKRLEEELIPLAVEAGKRLSSRLGFEVTEES